MKSFLGNVLLALAWVAVTGDFSIANFALGFLVGLGVLWLAGPLVGARRYLYRLGAAMRLAAIMFREVAVASAQVAHDVLTPKTRARPAIVGLDLKAQEDMEILLIAILVTLTPGTVVVHLTEDRQRMYVYGMYVKDPEQFRNRIQRTFERRVLQVTRGDQP